MQSEPRPNCIKVIQPKPVRASYVIMKNIIKNNPITSGSPNTAVVEYNSATHFKPIKL